MNVRKPSSPKIVNASPKTMRRTVRAIERAVMFLSVSVDMRCSWLGFMSTSNGSYADRHRADQRVRVGPEGTGTGMRTGAGMGMAERSTEPTTDSDSDSVSDSVPIPIRPRTRPCPCPCACPCPPGPRRLGTHVALRSGTDDVTQMYTHVRTSCEQ